MFESIKKFMQSEDRNGNWLESKEDEKPYLLDTLKEWIADGLEVNPRIQGYIDYLGD